MEVIHEESKILFIFRIRSKIYPLFDPVNQKQDRTRDKKPVLRILLKSPNSTYISRGTLLISCNYRSISKILSISSSAIIFTRTPVGTG